MKRYTSFRRGVLAIAQLFLGLGLLMPCLAVPTISSVVVNPKPLVTGQAFTVTVSASSDVVQAIATVDFRPTATALLRVTLAKQGASWVGSGAIPSNVNGATGATVKVFVFDAARQRAEFTERISVTSPVLITAVFDPNSGVLTINGDDHDNQISVVRDPTGKILVNGGTVVITGGVPTVANTVLIKAFGFGGKDQISVDEAGGALPAVQFDGGAGDDILIGGTTTFDQLDGGDGNDNLQGRGGKDVLLGGGGQDVLTGGDGDDVAFGGAGKDLFIWNPGDDNDTLEGQADFDTMLFNGANIAEVIDFSANGGRLRFTRNIASVVMDANDVEQVVFNARGGADVITVNDLSGTDVREINLNLESFPGSTTGDGAVDLVVTHGTAGNDSISVTEFAGGIRVAGLPATISLVGVEPATDRLLVNGEGGAADAISLKGGVANEIVANGATALFSRGPSSLVVETDNVEKALVQGLSGADSTVIGELTGTDLVDVTVDLSGVPRSGVGDGAGDNISVRGTQGNDQIVVADVSGGLRITGLPGSVTILGADAALDRLTLDALGGDDSVNASALSAGRIVYVVNGGLGVDTLFGSQGDDLITGGDGNDVVFGGAGKDLFVWNPGDDNDTLEGQSDFDTMLFNGANAAEAIDFSANGGRLRFFRNIASVVMDANDVEQVVFNARGGADVITVNDLSGTDVTEINLNLESVPGSGSGDGAVDLIVANGTAGNDSISVTEFAGSLSVAGLPATITLVGMEPANDRLLVNGAGGAADAISLRGGVASEILANGSTALFSRGLSSVVVETDNVERAVVHGFSGADSTAIGDLTGTDLGDVTLDLAGVPGSGVGDGAGDNVSVRGTQGNDQIVVADVPGGLRVTGLPGSVTVLGADAALDRLTVDALAGDDSVNASALSGGRIVCIVNGGLGVDTLLGSQGDDLITGGDGNDVAFGGGGDDTFVWNPGDDNDTLEGQAGFDTMLFNGANIAEVIDFSANGGRLRFFRNIASVVMDANDVEQVVFNARGGADLITVNNLSGTDVTEINLNLESFPGSGLGDGAADTIVVNGTAGDDVVTLSGSAAGVEVLGLAARISIAGSEAAQDRLVINALAGDDVVEGSGLAAGAIQLTADGGADDDVLVGSEGDDVLLGGEGDDVLLGGAGLDVLDGGPGDNIVIQD